MQQNAIFFFCLNEKEKKQTSLVKVIFLQDRLLFLNCCQVVTLPKTKRGVCQVSLLDQFLSSLIKEEKKCMSNIFAQSSSKWNLT